LLVKNPGHEGKATIQYRDIGDYLSREEKLEIIAKSGHALHSEMSWQPIRPNEHGDWLNQRNDLFGTFIPLGDKDNKNNRQTVFVPYYSNGLKTQRDVWCYNFSRNQLASNIIATIEFYNSLVASYSEKPSLPHEQFAKTDSAKISWSRQFLADFAAAKEKQYNKNNLVNSLYSPFCKTNLYFDHSLNEMMYQIPKIFPTANHKNLVICLPAGKDGLPLISNCVPDLHFNGDSQCFPLYYYKQKETLFDKYAKCDGITDFIHDRCRENYGPKVTKEDIFYYVYGLLHSPDYRSQFSADLKKILPRLPLVEKPTDFWAFSKAGRTLADLHLNYERQPPCQMVMVAGAENGTFKVDKMRFSHKEDKTIIEYNPWIRLSNIPL
jgi:predicted helicase